MTMRIKFNACARRAQHPPKRSIWKRQLHIVRTLTAQRRLSLVFLRLFDAPPKRLVSLDSCFVLFCLVSSSRSLGLCEQMVWFNFDWNEMKQIGLSIVRLKAHWQQQQYCLFLWAIYEMPDSNCNRKLWIKNSEYHHHSIYICISRSCFCDFVVFATAAVATTVDAIAIAILFRYQRMYKILLRVYTCKRTLQAHI